MEIDVYTTEGYIIFESNGVIIYDFPSIDFQFFQSQLLDKSWYTIEVENKVRELCSE